ncbi:MAG: dimethylarginine dimethylaminohydrolase family protein [Actinomycetota bacterium]
MTEGPGRRFGGQSMVAPLRRVLVRRPRPADLAAWEAFGWRSAPDPVEIVVEHETFCAALEQAGAEVILAEGNVEGDPDAIYTYDPALVADAGAILLRSGKEARRAESVTIEHDLIRAGVPVAARLEEPACADGGDLCWFDESTLLAGRGYRTNDAGIETIRRALPDVEVLSFDLPHHRGPGEVLHLMSFLSPVDHDLAVVFPPLMPVRLVELLREREIAFVEVPEEELETMGPNVLALAPRVVLALDGNPRTRAALERAGVEVCAYKGNELSRRGDGGPTCLTRPILRG